VRAALLESPGQPFRIVDDVDIESPRAGEVKVRVHHCGVCHSDLHLRDGSIPGAVPSILGHEPAGVVEEVGTGVTELAPGDKVVLSARPKCGHCYWCIRGEPQLCARATELFTGLRADSTTPLSRGGQPVFIGVGLAAFAEYVVTQASGAIKIADDVPLDIAAVLGCAVQTGVGAVLNTAGVEAGATVLIVGLGGIGIAIAQGAGVAGASRIIGVDPLESRRLLAKGFGVTDLIDPAQTDVASAVLELTGGVGADYAFDAVGKPSIVESCFGAVRSGGTAVLVGVGGMQEMVTFPFLMFAVSEKTVKGCLLGSSDGARDIPLLLSLWRAGHLDLDGMVTARRPLDEIEDAFSDLATGTGLRTVIDI
jgi:S-(hydroxymethyl)glutathione dehydrogenase/alcohol dehydrogenase